MRPLALAYHAIGTRAVREDPHGLFVSWARLRRHVAWLQRRGLLAGDVRRAGRAREDGLCALTFDDGFRELLGAGGPRRSGDAVRHDGLARRPASRCSRRDDALRGRGAAAARGGGRDRGAHRDPSGPHDARLRRRARRARLRPPHPGVAARGADHLHRLSLRPRDGGDRARMRGGGLQRGLPDERVRLAVDAARLPARGHGRPGVAARAAAQGGGALRAADASARGAGRAAGGRQVRRP